MRMTTRLFGLGLIVVCGTLFTQEAVEPSRVFKGHDAAVYDLAFSPDSAVLATASFDKTIKLWSGADGAELATLTGHESKVLSIAVSPDGRFLLSGSDDKTVKLWEVPSGGSRAFTGHTDAVTAVCLASDETMLASGAADRSVRLWSRATGAVLHQLTTDAGVTCLAADAAGKRLAAGTGEDVRLWDVTSVLSPPAAEPAPPPPAGTVVLIEDGDEWLYLKGTAAPPTDWNKPGFDAGKWARAASGFGYSSNADELATVKTRLDDMANGGYLSLYLLRTFHVDDPARVKKLVLRVLVDDGFVAYLNGHEVARHNVDGNPPAFDGAAQAAAEPQALDLDITAHIDKLRPKDNVLALQGHNAAPTSSDFVLTPSLVAEGDAAAKKEVARQDPLVLSGLGSPILAVALSRDGKLAAAAGEADKVVVWNLENGAATHIFLEPGARVHALVFVDTARLAWVDRDGPVTLWHLAEARVVARLEGHEGRVHALAVSPGEEQLASAGEDGKVLLWDTAGGGKKLRTLEGRAGPVLSVTYAGDGKRVAAGGKSGALVSWSVETGEEVARHEQKGEIRSLAVALDGSHYGAAATEPTAGNTVFESRAPSLAARKTLSGHEGAVYAVAFSPDGNAAASGASDKTVRLWNLADGKQIRSIAAHESSVYCLAFSPDGSLLASGGNDKTIKLWNVASGDEIKKLEGHLDGVWCLRFSRGGEFLFSGSSDLSLRKWSVADGKQVAVFERQPGWVCGMALTPDGAQLLSADIGGNLLTWDAGSAKTLKHRKLPAVVYSLALSPDGKWLATANEAGDAFLIEN